MFVQSELNFFPSQRVSKRRSVISINGPRDSQSCMSAMQTREVHLVVVKSGVFSLKLSAMLIVFRSFKRLMARREGYLIKICIL